MKVKESDITVIMTAFNNFDFTKSAYMTFRRYHPHIRIIIVDGGSDFPTLEKTKQLVSENRLYYKDVDLIVLYNSSTEPCRNAGVELASTPFILTMDNDTKVLDSTSLFALTDVFENDKKEVIAQTGAYAVKLIDKKERKAYVSTEFKSFIKVDAFAAYFSMHRKDAYQEVGGMSTDGFFYDDIPEEIWKGKFQPNYQGDMKIGLEYQKNGYEVVTPRVRVPVVHWGRAYLTVKDDPLNEWWYENCEHIRCNPLDNWRNCEKN